MMNQILKHRIECSALWAAYGDILGFPTELVDEAGVQRRIGTRRISRPSDWKRLIGGKFGVWADLSAGTYSDDTQLRLATSRSIRGDGHFDVETFAKIELPIWLAYCLGAGRGSKLGATMLGQRGVNWFSNFFDQRDLRYVDGGGNGAAMRIQPHVWASQDLSVAETYLPDVVRNTLCTHGHPRAIAGAVIHAASLASVLQDSKLPNPSDWGDLVLYVEMAQKFIMEDPEISTFWLPTWDMKSGRSFTAEMANVKLEWQQDIAKCIPLLNGDPQTAYVSIVQLLGGFDAHQRGSGIKCALFSLVAAWCFRDFTADQALVTVANVLSSDTDTIGTMTGALLGALTTNEPQYAVQDRDYIRLEASRLHTVSRGLTARTFQYPDLMTWQAPKVQLDVIGNINGQLAIAGLGFVDVCSEEFVNNKADHSYQWFKLPFGQTVLCKRRITVSDMDSKSFPAIVSPPKPYVAPNDLERGGGKKLQTTRDLFNPNQGIDKTALLEEARNFREKNTLEKTSPVNGKIVSTIEDRQYLSHERVEKSSDSPQLTLDELTDQAIKSGFDPMVVGNDIIKMAEQPNGIELAISYAAILIKARQARLKKGRE